MKRLEGTEAISKARKIIHNSDSVIVLAIRFISESIEIFELYGHYYEMKINLSLNEYIFMEISKSMATGLVDSSRKLINDELVQVKFGGF